MRLLAKNVADRYLTAAEVIAALEPFTRKSPNRSTPPTKPVFAPGQEPPAPRAVPSTSDVQADRDRERSGRQSINSLSAPSTDDAFPSDRQLIHGDSSVSMAATISQSNATQGSRRRWPLMIGLSGFGLALLIGIAMKDEDRIGQQ